MIRDVLIIIIIISSFFDVVPCVLHSQRGGNVEVSLAQLAVLALYHVAPPLLDAHARELQAHRDRQRHAALEALRNPKLSTEVSNIFEVALFYLF